MTEKSITGAIGEHLVAVDLLGRGYRVSFASAGYPYDLVTEIDGRMLRVQVKASKALRKNRADYVFSINGGVVKDYDLIAFVALDHGTIAYLSASRSPHTKACFSVPGSKYHSRRKGKNFDENPLELALEDIFGNDYRR